jgi:hypothetical protein
MNADIISVISEDTPMREPVWTKAVHISGKHCSTLWRDNGYGIQMEKHCTRRGIPPNCSYTNSKTCFFIDGDKRHFKTQSEMMAALREKLYPSNQNQTPPTLS